eukprot:Sspe_Gene.43788::Locus_21396_Transcript_1_1_Confidence_1.000_Length_2624::g.43788::m.43788
MRGLQVLAALAAVGCTLAQYGPDPEYSPAEFRCAWRRLAYNYSVALRPDGAEDVYDALQLGKYCTGSTAVPRPDKASLPRVFPPTSAVPSGETTLYVDSAKGSDSNPGTEAHPMRTIQAAVDKAGDKSSAVIVLRKGTFYLGKPVEVTAKNSRLTIQNMPGEEVWLSGGVALEGLQWVEHNTTHGMNVWKADISKYGLSAVPALRINGRRISPARYPNADPETQFWPTGYLTSKRDDWLPSKIPPKPNQAKQVKVATPNREWDDYFSHYSGGIGGTCAAYDPPFSYWCQDTANFSEGCGGCETWYVPGGLRYHDALPTYPSLMKDTSGTLLKAWRAAHWANWAFDIASYHPENSTIVFNKGGFQGARGGPGSDWYIEGVLEELDTPGEYYYDSIDKALYVFSNNTGPPAEGTEIVAVVQHTLLRVTGESKTAPAKAVTVKGLGFRDTAPTMMEPHGVPSGGDWSLERLGVVFAENVEDFVVDTCKMWRLGGNAVMLSRYAMRSKVVNSEFVWLGGSAVAAWGWTDEITDGGVHGIDGTGGHFPRYTVIERNIFREIGVWEKQSSAFFQAKGAQSTVRHNVVYNLARAGFNYNDGFGGGDTIEENVLFNTCRESSDHGPINSWDRQPFLTTVRNGTPSTQMEWRQATRNVVIGNYGGLKGIDNDDGSLFWNVTSNFMAYGWGQKFKCGAIYSLNNLRPFLTLGSKFDAGCTTHSKEVFFPNLWTNDTIIVASNGTFNYRQCWGTSGGHDWDVTQVHDNVLYVNGKVEVQVTGCPSHITTLPELQKAGKEPGTKVVSNIPSSDVIIEWAKFTLGYPWRV